METKITQEMIERAKKAASAEELLAVAKENGVELTAEDAQKYFEMWHTSAELSDEELDNVAGGCGSEPPEKCVHCGGTEFYSMPASATASTYWCKKCGQLAGIQ